MRTSIDAGNSQMKALDGLPKTDKRSRAALIRQATISQDHRASPKPTRSAGSPDFFDWTTLRA